MNSRKHDRETEQILSSIKTPESLISYTLSIVIRGQEPTCKIYSSLNKAASSKEAHRFEGLHGLRLARLKDMSSLVNIM